LPTVWVFGCCLLIWRRSSSNALVDQPTALLFANHIIDLVALALGKGPGEAAEPPGVRAAQRSAILREIEGRRSDLGLSAATVARRLGITPRYVHLLLEETGRSLTHHVLEKRLDTAAAMLRSPLWRTRKIAEIAAQAGFNDLSYFNRAFRRRFGATPSDLREAAWSESRHSGQNTRSGVLRVTGPPDSLHSNCVSAGHARNDRFFLSGDFHRNPKIKAAESPCRPCCGGLWPTRCCVRYAYDWIYVFRIASKFRSRCRRYLMSIRSAMPNKLVVLNNGQAGG
jgi:AraC-like DNA-binding protein